MGQIKNIKLHIVTDIKNIHIDTTTQGTMSSHKTFIIKRKLAHKMNMNRPVPQWVRMKTGNKIRYNAKKTLEKNQTWTLKRSEKAALIWKSFWKSLVDSLHWLMFLNHEMDTSRILVLC